MKSRKPVRGVALTWQSLPCGATFTQYPFFVACTRHPCALKNRTLGRKYATLSWLSGRPRSVLEACHSFPSDYCCAELRDEDSVGGLSFQRRCSNLPGRCRNCCSIRSRVPCPGCPRCCWKSERIRGRRKRLRPGRDRFTCTDMPHQAYRLALIGFCQRL